MGLLESFFARAKARAGAVVLPEGEDPRILSAARRLADQGLARPIVLGSATRIADAAVDVGVSLEGFGIVDPRGSEQLGRYAEVYAASRGLPLGAARRLVSRPLFFGGMMVAQGAADAMVGGVASATATVIQAGALTVGMAAGIRTPSSFFLMLLPHGSDRATRALVFADCAVNIDPTSEELADIALASARSAQQVLAETPRVALLSFSTRGSASHARVEKITEALRIVRRRNPELAVDGELQADAALDPTVAAKKVPGGSAVAGQANVLIFPDLDSGNIGYKLTQYLAGAQAIGPFLQGFAKPVSDLSRGASVEDVVATTAITLAQV
jgi:phosphate acetyltransferase